MSYRSHKLFSVKTKTVVLVLSIYLILSTVFFIIRYMDIKAFAIQSQNSELSKVKLVYKETLRKAKKFYINRGYANINSFGIRKAFENNDSQSLHSLSEPRWNIINQENPYLRSFCFYDSEGKLLTYFGASPQKKLFKTYKPEKPYAGFAFHDHTFSYQTVAVARGRGGAVIGYATFVLDPRFFLSEIRKLMNIYTYIVYQKSDGKKMLFMLKEDTNIKNIIKSHEIKNAMTLQTDKGVFLTSSIEGSGLGRENNFKIIFLQDILHWKNLIQKAILQSLIAMLLLMFVTMMVINYGFDIILKELDASNKKLRHSQDELEKLNKNLQDEIKKEISLKLKKEREANENERILVHQSKLASMGEMIGNIAHQWRQPLTELSSILINLKLHFERDKLTKEAFQSKVKDANKQIEFMSKTVDDFRNFFSSKKKKESYDISYIIHNVHKLMGASLKNNDIDFHVDIKNDFQVYGYPNEISQALINIVGNAKDVILERGIQNPSITICTILKNDKKIISVIDNAGGIKTDPIDKIFEPYFSTKHAKSGTGIGLYMTKTIIEKNNDGKIKVHNTEQGAVFTIIF